MKHLIALFIVFTMGMAPAFCQEVVKITNLVNVYTTEVRDVLLNDKGYTQEVTTTIKHYEYLTDKGERVELPYKVKGAKDARIWKARHPYLYAALPLVPTIIWNLITMRP